MNTNLIALRERIAEVDIELLKLLEERMSLADDIAEVKKENSLPIEDKKREMEIIEERKMNTSLNPNFVEEFCSLVFKESKRLQQEFYND